LAKRKMTMESDEPEADIRTKTEIVNSGASKHQQALKKEKTLTQKITTQQAKINEISKNYFALLAK